MDKTPFSGIRLLATDLDGTLVGRTKEYFRYTEFRDRILHLRREYNIVWAICTGRSRRGFHNIFSPLRGIGISPDYVITKDAYISEVNRFGLLVPKPSWNLTARKLLRQHNDATELAFSEWYKLLTSWDFGLVKAAAGKGRMVFRFSSEESAGKATELLQEKAGKLPHVKVVRVHSQVHVFSEVFTKGLAVRELTRFLGFESQHVLAIGDGRNDQSMFREDVAHQTGCPANAKGEIVKLVHETGGHIARKAYLEGVMEVIDAFENGTVNSNHPEGWKEPLPPGEIEPASTGDTAERLLRAGLWVLVGILVLVGIVLAKHGMIPGL